MSRAISSPGAHTPKRPHSSFGLSAPTGPSMLSAHRYGNSMGRVVLEAAAIPVDGPGLRRASRIRRTAQEQVIPRFGVPVERPPTPRVRRRRQRPERGVRPRRTSVDAHLDAFDDAEPRPGAAPEANRTAI